MKICVLLAVWLVLVVFACSAEAPETMAQPTAAPVVAADTDTIHLGPTGGTVAAKTSSSTSTVSTRTPSTVNPRAHLLLTLEVREDGLRVVDSRAVALPLPRAKVSRQGPWRTKLLDRGGRTLFEVEMPAANQLRGEFASPGGKPIDSYHIHRERSAFAVRLPLLRDAKRIRLEARAGTLDERDPHRAGVEPEAWVVLGEVAYPEVTP